MPVQTGAAPLRVTILTGDFYPDQIGGQGIYAFELATRAAALGLEIRVVCPTSPGRERFEYPARLRVRCVREPAANALTYTARVTPLLAGLSADTDLFHVNELFGFSAAFARKDRGLVISSHNSYLDRMRAARGLKKLRYPPLVALERLTYPKADRVIIGSEIERAPVRQLGVDEARIVEIPYGVDLERFTDPERVRRNRVRERLGIPRDAEVGLFVGRFVERKKPHVAAQAFAELAQERPQFHAIFVGDGTLLPAIRAASTGAAKLHFLGAVPFSELAPFYAAADVFALPSVGEGSISLAVLEAAAAGLPLVLTLDSAGQSRVFEPNQNGEIVRLDDAADLVRGLRQALQKRHAYAKRSRELVVEHFSWDACAKATIRCYEDALRTRSR